MLQCVAAWRLDGAIDTAIVLANVAHTTEGCVCKCIHIYTYEIYVFTYIYTYIYKHIYVFIYIYVYVFTNLYMYIYMFICIYTCMYTYAYF